MFVGRYRCIGGQACWPREEGCRGSGAQHQVQQQLDAACTSCKIHHSMVTIPYGSLGRYASIILVALINTFTYMQKSKHRPLAPAQIGIERLWGHALAEEPGVLPSGGPYLAFHRRALMSFLHPAPSASTPSTIFLLRAIYPGQPFQISGGPIRRR